MRRPWLAFLFVAVIAAAAGVAIAGLPDRGEQFTIGQPSTSPPSTTAAEATTTTTIVGSMAPVPTTTPTASTTAPATTEPPPTSATPLKTEPTNTEPPATNPFGIDRSSVRLVVANADGRTGLASTYAARLTALGYTQINLGDATQTRDQSAIYYRTDHLEEAAAVAADLAIPDIPLLEMPVVPLPHLTNSDGEGDVIVLLGANAPL